MDCLRSFNFDVNTNTNLTGGNVKTWATGSGNHFWSASAGTASTYNIEGYKNINVYGIDVIGSIQTLTTAGTGGVVVNDWSIDVLIGGQQPLIGANVTASPNYYSINATTPANRIFPIGKTSNSIKFGDPYESVKFIQLGSTYASGWGWETTGNVNLFWNLNFIVYYKFEGE
jgi:hypothetical protein